MLRPNTGTRLQLTSFARSVIQQNVRTYSNRYVKIPTLDVCRVCISPTHKLPHTATAILSDPSHVLYPRLSQRYEPIIKRQHDEFQEGLWVVHTSNPMRRTKVVRSWARRRVAQAVSKALEFRGFDGKGRKIDIGAAKDGQAGRNGESGPDALIGTVDIEVMNSSVETKFAEVERQAGLVVDAILRICGRRKAEIYNPRIRRMPIG